MVNVRAALLDEYLGDCRALIRPEIEAIIPSRAQSRRGFLYDLMLEYPLREAKGLRPALCIASCRALGGRLGDILPTAAVLELFHNAFLVHDDVEDGSKLRRGRETLHQAYGVPIAINVGDGMLMLALQPLLDNTRHVGLSRALRVLEIVARMCRESVEGQAIELEWIRTGAFGVSDREYLGMVLKKTGWYTFIAPVLLGAVVAGVRGRGAQALRRYATLLGVAFQIHDDVLNLDGEEVVYGKEIAGDLEEGKRTLILIHALRSMDPESRHRAERALRCSREERRPEDLAWLSGRIRELGSIERARRVSERYALKARRALADAGKALPRSVHREFIEALIDFTIQRKS